MSDDRTTDTTTTPTKTTAAIFTIDRDGNRPLRFRGELIGTGEHGSGGSSGYRCDWNRGVKVYIYRRTSGGYVVARTHWSCWQGEHDTSGATVCKDAAAVLAELRRDEYGEPGGSIIPPAEAEALADASGSDEQIAAVSVEDLDE